MSKWENTVITAKGNALLSKLVQGNTLTITKAVSGAGYVTPGTLQNQTAISDPKQTLRFRSLSFPAEGKSEVTCYLTNDGLAAEYTAKQIGVYAKDPDEGEILFFITQATSGSGTDVPAEAESPGFSAEWAFTFSYGQADTVSVTVDPSNTVTQDGMEKYVAEATDPFRPTKEASGIAIAIDDSAKLPLIGMSIYGKSKQVSTTGKNLLPNTAVTQTINGVTFTKNDDGSVSAKGTSTVSDPIRYTIGEVELPAGNYFVTGQDAGASSTFLMYSDQGGNFLNQHSGQDAPLTLTESAIISVHLVVFEKASPNLKVYPMIRDASKADATYEPYTGGAPAPSPDFPQEIKSAAEDGSVKVRVFGKNLIESLNTEKTVNGVTFKPNGDGGIIATGTATASAAVTLEYKTPPPGVYLLSGGTANTRVVSRLTYKDGTADVYVTSYNGITREVVITEKVLGHSAYIEVRNGVTVAGEVIYPMLREATIDDAAYEEYAMQELSIETPNGLHGIPVTSGGNYTDENGQQWACDEIDFARGVYIQRIQEIVIDGTQAVATDGADLNPWRKYIWINNAPAKAGCIGLCDKLRHRDSTELIVGNSVLDAGFNLSEHYNVIYFNVGYLMTEDTVEAAKEVLKVHPLTVKYVLATPVVKKLTPEEISAYKALTANNPHTTITNTDGAEMKVQYLTKTFERTVNAILNRDYRIVDGEKEWINPPMIAGVEYRTSERSGGVPVYAKRVSFTPAQDISIDGDYYIPHGITGLVCSVRCIAIYNRRNFLPWLDYSNNSFSNVATISGESITLRNKNTTWKPTHTIVFDLYYTKE